MLSDEKVDRQSYISLPAGTSKAIVRHDPGSEIRALFFSMDVACSFAHAPNHDLHITINRSLRLVLHNGDKLFFQTEGTFGQKWDSHPTHIICSYAGEPADWRKISFMLLTEPLPDDMIDVSVFDLSEYPTTAPQIKQRVDDMELNTLLRGKKLGEKSGLRITVRHRTTKPTPNSHYPSPLLIKNIVVGSHPSHLVKGKEFMKLAKNILTKMHCFGDPSAFSMSYFPCNRGYGLNLACSCDMGESRDTATVVGNHQWILNPDRRSQVKLQYARPMLGTELLTYLLFNPAVSDIVVFPPSSSGSVPEPEGIPCHSFKLFEHSRFFRGLFMFSTPVGRRIDIGWDDISSRYLTPSTIRRCIWFMYSGTLVGNETFAVFPTVLIGWAGVKDIVRLAATADFLGMPELCQGCTQFFSACMTVEHAPKLFRLAEKLGHSEVIKNIAELTLSMMRGMSVTLYPELVDSMSSSLMAAYAGLDLRKEEPGDTPHKKRKISPVI